MSYKNQSTDLLLMKGLRSSWYRWNINDLLKTKTRFAVNVNSEFHEISFLWKTKCWFWPTTWCSKDELVVRKGKFGWLVRSGCWEVFWEIAFKKNFRKLPGKRLWSQLNFCKFAGFKNSWIKHPVTDAFSKFLKIMFSWNIIEEFRLTVEDEFVTGSVWLIFME